MSDLALTDLGDILISPTGLARITEDSTEETTQRLRMRLRRWRGEWFRNASLGVPYRQEVLIKNPDLQAIRSRLKSEIESDRGVDRVTEISITHDRATRVLTGSFTVVLISGVELDDSLLLGILNSDLGDLILDDGTIIVL